MTGSERGRRIAAARPTLFDTVAYPEVLISMLLANLTSPSLWDFRRSIEEQRSVKTALTLDGESGVAGCPSGIEQIQQYANHHLSHIAPLGVADQWGIIELSDIEDRIGKPVLDYTMDTIRAGLIERRERGELQSNQNILEMMAEGRFPEYDYSIIDLVRAHRNLLGRKKHKPWGVTHCADEAVLIASLACVLDQVRLSRCVIFGSPLHYAVLLEHSGRIVLVNGKQHLYEEGTWHTDFPIPKDSLAELERIIPLDRLISVNGAVDLGQSIVTMTAPGLAAVTVSFRQFLGVPLPQLIQAARIPISKADHPPVRVWDQLDECTSADRAREELSDLARQFPGSVLDLARYSAREIDVPDPTIFLDAALRGQKVRAAAKKINNLTDALDVLRSISGHSSVLRSRDRVALPDEVLLFGTGDDVDRALLLTVLLAAARRSDFHAGFTEQHLLELVVTETGSFVRSGADWVDASSLASVQRPEGVILCQLKT